MSGIKREGKGRKEGRRLKAHWMAEPSQDLSLLRPNGPFFAPFTKKAFRVRRAENEKGRLCRVLRGKERGEKKGGAREGGAKEGYYGSL